MKYQNVSFCHVHTFRSDIKHFKDFRQKKSVDVDVWGMCVGVYVSAIIIVF